MKKFAIFIALAAGYVSCATEAKKTEVNVQAPNVTIFTSDVDGEKARENIQKAVEASQQSAIEAMSGLINLQNLWFNTTTNGLIATINKNKAELVANINQMFSNFQKFLASAARDLAKDKIAADKEMLNKSLEHSMEKMKYALNAIGTGLYNFTNDKKRITFAAVSIGGLIATGYVAKRSTKVISNHVSAMLQKPNLVTETSRKNLIQVIKHPIKTLFSKGEDLPEPTYPKELQEHINTYIKSIIEGKIHGDPFRHALFFGKPGTGKTLLAKYIAKKLGMDYAIINAANLFQFADPVSELNNLFEWANSSSKGIVLFFDEVDAIAASRLKDISEQTRKIQNTFYAHTGSETKKFILLLATNQPELIDPAMLSRMDEKIHFPLPDIETRKKLLDQYLAKYSKIKLEENLCHKYAEKIVDFSGREISQVARAIKAASYSNNNVIDIELVDKCINQAIAQKQALENYSFGK